MLHTPPSATSWLPRLLVALCLAAGSGCALDLPALAPPDGSPEDAPSAEAPSVDASDADAPSTEGGPPDTLSPDTFPPMPNFAGATKIPGVNSSAYDDGPHLSVDGLRLYFSSDRSGGSGGSDIWIATRDTRGENFGTPTPLAAINSADNDGDPTLTDDELLIMFERDQSSGPGEIYQATRNTILESFGPPTPVDSLNKPGSSSEDPALAGDGLSVVFGSDRDASGGQDIWYASRSDRAHAFSGLVRLPQLNTTGKESDPSLAGELFIVFESERGDVGFSDLYIARRIGGPTEFESPSLIGALSTNQPDDDPFIRIERRLIVFSSKRSGSEGGDLYWSGY